jgi:hypothetical protein
MNFQSFSLFPTKEKYKTEKEKHFFLEVPVFSTNKDPSKQVPVGTIHMSHVFRNWTQRRVSNSFLPSFFNLTSTETGDGRLRQARA